VTIWVFQGKMNKITKSEGKKKHCYNISYVWCRTNNSQTASVQTKIKGRNNNNNNNNSNTKKTACAGRQAGRGATVVSAGKGINKSIIDKSI
jgi:hypothetical protein